MKEIVLTEKRKVAEMFALALEPAARKNKFSYEGDHYVIVWARGHLFQLARPEKYDAIHRKSSFATLPIEPDIYQFEPIPDCVDLIDFLSKEFARDDLNALTIATDCGREGEVIARLCLQQCGWNLKKKTYRFWTSDALNAEAIQRGMKNRIPYHEKSGLYESGLARMIGDWHVGINGSRALGCRLRSTESTGKISTGRIQGPTLRLIMQRQLERENFKPEDFWTLRGLFVTEKNHEFMASWFASCDQNDPENFLPEDDEEVNEENSIDKPRTRRFRNVYDINKKINACGPHGINHKALKGKLRITPRSGPNGKVEGQITDIIGLDGDSRGFVSISPPMLFNLTTLMQEANKIYGMTMNRTAEVAQELYLDLGLISYPRTDSRVLNVGMIDQVSVLLKTIKEDGFIDFDETRLILEETSRNFDDKRIVEDHHAIIPSGKKPDIEAMTTDQKRLYSLISKRFIAVFYPPYEYQSIRIEIRVESEMLEARRTVLINGGWRDFLKGKKHKKEKEEDPFVGLTLDTRIWLKAMERYQDKTICPPPYNDATLLQAMTTIHNKITPESEDSDEAIHIESLKRVLRRTSGLGTPASRPGIIGGMINGGILHRLGRGRGIEPTQKGRLIFQALEDEPTMDFETSAIWELELEKISRREGASIDTFMTRVKIGVRSMVDHVRSLPSDFGKIEDKIGPCPLCNKEVVNKLKNYACQDYPHCNFNVWKNRLSVFGKEEIDREEASKLIRKQTLSIKGLKKKDGSSFDANAFLDYSDDYGWTISFKDPGDVFEKQKAVHKEKDPVRAEGITSIKNIKQNHIKKIKRSLPGVQASQLQQKVAQPAVLALVKKEKTEQASEPQVLCCKEKGAFELTQPRPSIFGEETKKHATALWAEVAPKITTKIADEVFAALLNQSISVPAVLSKHHCSIDDMPFPPGTNSYMQILKKGLDRAIQKWIEETTIQPSFGVYQRVRFVFDGNEEQGTIQSVLKNKGTYLVYVTGGIDSAIEVAWEKTYCFKCKGRGAEIVRSKSLKEASYV